MAGKPRKMTEERTQRVVDAILAGAPQKVAARHGGISPATHFSWIAQGEAALKTAGDDPDRIDDAGGQACAQYATRIDEARREWELRQLALIQRAAQGQPWRTSKTVTKTDKEGSTVTETVVTEGVTTHWQAAAWLLERRYPQVYAQIRRTEHTGEGGGPIEVSTAEQLVARGEEAIDELRRRRERKAG